MVKQLFLILLCMLPVSVSANGALTMTLSQSKVELGKPVQATIATRGIKNDISNIDLNLLRNVFGVVINESSSSTDKSGAKRQQLNVSLYPRKTGISKVPQLLFDGARTRPMSIMTTDARAPGAKISFSSNHNEITGWQRQQHILSIRIVTPDKFASLTIENIETPGIIAVTIPPQRETDLKGNSILTTGWVFSSYQDGISNLQLPAINYRLHGKVQRKFYLPVVKLETYPLPAYIPPNMVVGKLSINTPAEHRKKLLFAESFTWKVHLTGVDNRIGSTPSIERQLQQSHSMSFGPISHTRTNSNDHSLASNTIILSVPVTFSFPGYYSLPDLRIQYFDPGLGRLQTITYTPDAVVFINPVISSIVIVILLIVLLITIRYLTKRVYAWLICRKSLNKLGNALLLADTPSDLIQLLRDYAKIRGWDSNISLGKWQHYWTTVHGTEIIPYLEDLSAYYYGNDKYSAEQQQALNVSLYKFIVKQRNCLFMFYNKKMT